MPLLPHRLPALLGMTLTAAAFGTHTYAADTMQDMDIHGMRAAAVHVPDGTASADAPLYEFTLDEIVVTGYRTRTPLTLITDPQQPRQPVPAADGGGYLKTIPGFSLVRKGGVSGDPMLRKQRAAERPLWCECCGQRHLRTGDRAPACAGGARQHLRSRCVQSPL